MSFRVLVPQSVAREGVEELLDAKLEVVEPAAWDLETLKRCIGGCHGILVRTARLPRELLERAPELRVISRHGVGLDNIDLGYCAKRGIVVTNAPEANANAVAEHTIGMIVAITKNLLLCDREIRRGDFDARHRHYGIELEGKTLGVVGLGRIGRLVAKKAAHGLNMDIAGYDPFLLDEGMPGFVETEDLEGLLARSDVVTLHMPLTASTVNLFGRARLFEMKEGAYLVNCARGGIVDEGALEEALRTGRLAAAALDVFGAEPTGDDHPLWGLDNVLVTPHMAAHTRESLARMAVHAAQGIVSVARDEVPRWPVDTESLANLGMETDR